MTYVVRCNCGQNADSKIKVVGGYNVGDMIRATGYHYIILRDGNSMWLCPACFEKSHKLALELAKILGPKHRQVYFPSLLPKEE